MATTEGSEHPRVGTDDGSAQLALDRTLPSCEAGTGPHKIIPSD